jgi:ClpP class serine protease
MKRRTIKLGEALAIMPEALQRGPGAMWWDYGAPAKDNDRCGEIAVVYVREALDHHRGYGGCSYESVLDHVASALSGEDVCEAYRRAHYYDRYSDEEKEPEPVATPPTCVVLRIDSPGGVVSGLNETVFALRRMSDRAGIPLIAYVDEMSTSAAFALACACDEIVVPPSAIAGSIGVISTMGSQAERDKREGFDIRLLTSGARKADGHPHAPLTDAAITAEQRRVDKLAKQFYRLVADVRPISAKDAEALQAGIFIGKDAVAKGLADAVMGWDTLLATLDARYGDRASPTPAEQKPVDKPSRTGPGLTQLGATGAKRATEKPMSLALQALVTKTKADIAKEKDPARKTALAGALKAAEAALAEYKKVKHTKETHEEESGEEDDEEEESGNETDRNEAADDGDGDDDSDDDKDDDEDDEDEEKGAKKAKATASILAQLSAATGVKGKSLPGAVKALVEKALKYDALAGDVAKLKATQTAATKNALIDEAVAQRRITRAQAKDLRGSRLSFVRGFLGMHKTALVNIDDTAAHQPDGSVADADIGAAAKKMTEQAIVAQGLEGEKATKFREAAYAAHRERMAKTNGAGVY